MHVPLAELPSSWCWRPGAKLSWSCCFHGVRKGKQSFLRNGSKQPCLPGVKWGKTQYTDRDGARMPNRPKRPVIPAPTPPALNTTKEFFHWGSAGANRSFSPSSIYSPVTWRQISAQQPSARHALVLSGRELVSNATNAGCRPDNT